MHSASAVGSAGATGPQGATGPAGVSSWTDGTGKVTTTVNVGIGTATPGSALEVAGAVKATSFSGGGLVGWQPVTGASQQAVVNQGYLATNGTTVTVTLPASPSVGDIVRVSGAGAGGWQIAQNAGQAVLLETA